MTPKPASALYEMLARFVTQRSVLEPFESRNELIVIRVGT